MVNQCLLIINSGLIAELCWQTELGKKEKYVIVAYSNELAKNLRAKGI